MTQKARGRETALDMLRTLLVVFALVVPLWFFGQGGPGDKKRIRPVSTTDAYAAFVADFHGPVLTSTPAGWVATVVDDRTAPGVLRIGYVRDDHYLEFVGSRGTTFVAEASGRASRVGAVLVGGVTWQDLRTSDGRESLVLTRGGTTVLIGGLRETATPAELRTFAALVR